MRLTPLALAITALLASTAQATTPPNPTCADVLADVRQKANAAPAEVEHLHGEWRRWLTARAEHVGAPSKEATERWIFALRAFNRLTSGEKASTSAEISAALAGWSATSLDGLVASVAAYQIEIDGARGRLAPILAASQTRLTEARTREANSRPAARPGWWTRMWDSTAQGKWQGTVDENLRLHDALLAAQTETQGLEALDKKLQDTSAHLLRITTFLDSLKATAASAQAHPVLTKTPGDATDDQTLALLTVLYLNEGVRLDDKVNPVANAWADFAAHREALRKTLVEGQVAMPSVPAPIAALFATDADVVALEKRLDKILKASGIDGTELEAKLESIGDASEADQREALVGYFDTLGGKIPFGQLGALSDLVAVVKKTNAAELASIRQYLATNKVTRRNSRTTFAKVKEQSKRAAELVGHQLRVVKLERVLALLKNPPKRVLRAERAVGGSTTTYVDNSTYTSSSDDFFTYYFLWWMLMHDSSPNGIHQAAHYSTPAAQEALDGRPLADVPAAPADGNADAPFAPVGDDFGGAKPGDFVPQDDGQCGIGAGGDFAPQLDSGLSFAGGGSDSGTLDFSQSVDLGGTTSGGSDDSGGYGGGSDYSGGYSGGSDYSGGYSGSDYGGGYSGGSDYSSGGSDFGGGGGDF